MSRVPPEPSPVRDNGPFDSPTQALRQFNAQTWGMPLPNGDLAWMVLREALMLTGVEVSTFESKFVGLSAREGKLDPITAQIIAGWLIRTRLAGADKTD